MLQQFLFGSQDSSCDICHKLEAATPIGHGQKLTVILDKARDGCTTCSLVSAAVLRLRPEQPVVDDIKVGWDNMRIQGLRIVVGKWSEDEFLFAIDMYTEAGEQLSQILFASGISHEPSLHHVDPLSDLK